MKRIRPVRLSFEKGLLLLLLLFPAKALLAQELSDYLRFAEEAKAEGDHHEAVGYLRKALELAPQRTKTRYELAHALRRSKLYKEALEQYKKVQEEDRRGERFPQCLRWVAEMQEFRGKYRQAGRSWGNLKRRYVRQKDSYLYKLAAQKSRSVEWAKKALEDSSTVQVEREKYPINTTGSEFAPFILQDSIFFFTALRAEEEKQDGTIQGAPPRSHILKAKAISKEKESKGGEKTIKSAWSEPRPIEGPWDQELHMANSCFTDSGRTLFFSSCKEQKGKKRCRIMRSRKRNDEWQEPTALPKPVNRDCCNTTHPMIGHYNGQEVLFFSSDRPEGLGKMDIWWTARKGNGDFGPVRNAGDSINGPNNEITPFYLEAKDQLYFASDWHPGFGGYDLFKSKAKKKGFGRPENLGHPVNSSYNDLYPFIDMERSKGFFASDRKGSREGWAGICCNDIYQWPIRIEPPSDTVKITSVEDLNRFLPVTLYFHNDRPDPNTRDTSTEVSYDASYRDYKERLPTYIERYSKGFSGSLQDTAKQRMKRFFDEKVDSGMQNLRLFSELLLKELKKGQDIELTVKGYASPLAKTEYNVHLTKRRIASLINYLKGYKDSAYIPYLEGEAPDGGSLSFLYKPYGEYSADTVVSDNLQNKQESVYSVSAALERKIEIERVKQVRKDTTYAELSFKKGVHDFGRVHPDSSYHYKLRFKNEGADTLRVDSVRDSTQELSLKLDQKVFPPGSKGNIKIELEPAAKKGKQVRSIVIYSNGVSRKRKASVTYELKDQR